MRSVSPSETVERKWETALMFGDLISELKGGVPDADISEETLRTLRWPVEIALKLASADSFFVSTRVAAAIEVAAGSLPLTHAFSDVPLLSAAGFVRIEGGIEINVNWLEDVPEEVGTVTSPRRADYLLWYFGDDLSQEDGKDLRQYLFLVPFVSHDSGAAVPITRQPIVYSLSLDLADQEAGIAKGHPDYEGPAIKDSVHFLRWLMAFAVWTDQRIANVESVSIERHARKRLDRAATDRFNRNVSVIVLRKNENDHSSALTEDEERWACQWVVSGHWRHQYHPSDGSRRLRWIFPYVKGPEDKPMKARIERLFNVMR